MATSIKGISFPFRRSATSFPATSEGDEKIAENIRRILLVGRGERVMHPDEGADAVEYVFEGDETFVDPLTRAVIDNDIRRALAIGEPRIQVVSITPELFDADEGGVGVRITLVYRRRGRLGTVKVDRTS